MIYFVVEIAVIIIIAKEIQEAIVCKIKASRSQVELKSFSDRQRTAIDEFIVLHYVIVVFTCFFSFAFCHVTVNDLGQKMIL